MTAGDNGSVFNNAKGQSMTTMSLTGTGDAKPAGGQFFGKGILEMERENESSRPNNGSDARRGYTGNVGWPMTAGMVGAGTTFILSMFVFVNSHMNEKMVPIAQAIEAGNARMARIEATSEQTVKDLAQLSGAVGGLTHRVDGIDKRLDKIDDRLDKIDDRLDRMDDRLAKMDERMNNDFGRMSDKLDRILASQSRRR